MKNYLVRGVGLALALTLLPALIGAQKHRPPGDPPPSASHCHASGIRCWFGSAAPCAVTCTAGTARCIGATCNLGFASAAECYCDLSGVG